MKQLAFVPDRIDMKILRQLQLNGKITNLSLAREVGLSTAPTLERVKKLEHFKFIKSYHAEVDGAMLGLSVQAIILVTLSRHRGNSFGAFEKAIRDIPEIVECNMITGNADYMLKAMVKNVGAFEKLITEKLSSIEEIGNLNTSIILSNVKKSVLLPVAY